MQIIQNITQFKEIFYSLNEVVAPEKLDQSDGNDNTVTYKGSHEAKCNSIAHCQWFPQGCITWAAAGVLHVTV